MLFWFFFYFKKEDLSIPIPSPSAAAPLCPSCSSSFWISQSPPSSAASAVYAESSLPVRQMLLLSIQVTLQQIKITDTHKKHVINNGCY